MFPFDRNKRCNVFNALIELSRAAPVRNLLKRRSFPLARRLAERHSESYHPSDDSRTRQVISVIGAWAPSKAVTTSSRRELSRAAPVRNLLKRRSFPLARRLAERHSESYHPSDDSRTRQVISVIGA